MVWTLLSTSSRTPSVTSSTPMLATAASPVATHPSPGAGGASGKTTKDYTLPPSFFPLLSQPLQDVLHERVPIYIASNPPRLSAGAPSHPFMNAIKTIADAKTWNGADAYSTTDSPLVGLFFDYAPYVEPTHLRGLLAKAWKDDPVATMQIILQGRSIHEGKGMRKEFYLAAGWLMDNHPRTLIDNLHLIVDPTCARYRNKERDAEKARKAAARNHGVLSLDEDGEVEGSLSQLPEYPARPHGYYKDLIELLILYVNGELNATSDGKLSSLKELYHPSSMGKVFKARRVNGQRTGFSHEFKKKASIPVKEGSWQESLLKADKTARFRILGRRLEHSLATDKKFQALYIAVVDLFVKGLQHDLHLLAKHKDFLRLSRAQQAPFAKDTSPHLFGMSYAAKWVPSPGKSADRQLHFATAIATIMCPGLEVNHAREQLQKTVLAPLREVLNVPETKMKKGKWSIDYTKVPAKCMSNNAANFVAHDPEGFKAYLTNVAKGRYAISGASLLPHELLMDAVDSNPIIAQLADLQWKSLVSSIASSSTSKLSNCLAIADVSGSMGSYLSKNKSRPAPVSVCIALTLLLGELASAPWNGSFFTFSSDPQIQHIDTTASLSQRASTLSCADWEMSTAYYKVFDLILSIAKANNLKQDQMVQRLFVFSDMQFDQARDNRQCETEHQRIKRKFAEAGYELPELIYWNLAASDTGISKPARATEENVSLVSGYSGALMKHFLRQEDKAAVEAEEELVNDMSQLGAKRVASPSVASGEKAKTDPMKTLRAILDSEAFKGVVIRD